jgi:hypothetical protein
VATGSAGGPAGSTNQLVTRRRGDSASVEVLQPDALARAAAVFPQTQAAPATRKAYAATYRQLVAFLAPATPTRLTWTPRRSSPYATSSRTTTPSRPTIARHLSAMRRLAAHLGADAAVQTVRSQRVAPGEPRPLTKGRVRPPARHA